MLTKIARGNMLAVPDFRRARCVPSRGGCGKKASEVGPISWGGLCGDCARVRLVENIDGLHTMTGEPVKRWRRGMAACVGAVLLDDPPPQS